MRFAELDDVISCSNVPSRCRNESWKNSSFTLAATLSMSEMDKLDEVIINFVQEIKLIYDKKHPEYKNLDKKRKAWTEISENIKNTYNVNMTGKIEKNKN